MGRGSQRESRALGGLMLRKLILLLPVLLGATTALADGPSTDATAAGSPDKAVSAAAAAAPAEPGGDVKMSGMSILGNEDAPKSLVLVPWKSSKLGDMPSVSRLLDSSKQPVDKEVFLRELSYYEFRTGTK